MQKDDEVVRETVEAYRRIGDPEDPFDIDFWQSQGAAAIFEAALDLVLTVACDRSLARPPFLVIVIIILLVIAVSSGFRL